MHGHIKQMLKSCCVHFRLYKQFMSRKWISPLVLLIQNFNSPFNYVYVNSYLLLDFHKNLGPLDSKKFDFLVQWQLIFYQTNKLWWNIFILKISISHNSTYHFYTFPAELFYASIGKYETRINVTTNLAVTLRLLWP